ncbi:MAG TPA: ABC transporter permease [Pyrinomonadaceae bacterium]|nr:ABC transporter permease [Pyrinomonadaceae bacterium]
MESLLQDVRYGVRMLLKKPGFTAVAVIALALGVGANTAIFSVVNGVLLQPLPYPEPERLVRLGEWSPQVPGMSISYPNLKDWREQNTVFENIAGTQFGSYNLTGAGEPERLPGRNVSWDFFDVLGVKVARGRSLRPEDDRAGAPPVCLISHGLWQRRFGGDPQIVGKSLSLSGESFEVIGILPPEYRFGTTTDVFAALGRLEASERLRERGNHPGIYAFARLKPGVTFEQAEAEMKGLAARLAQSYPNENGGNSITIVPLREYFVGDIRTSLLVLLAAVGSVLLIACANVANLMLVRATSRAREIAIRTALGAGRLRIVRQLLTESIILALLGGTAGLLLALWGVDVLRGASLDVIPTTAEVAVDRTVLVFTLGVSVLTGVLFGLAPALKASKLDLNVSLKEGGRAGADGSSKNRLRSVLVVFDVAISLVLLVSAGLLIRSFMTLLNTETGFDPKNLLTMSIAYTSGETDAHGAKAAEFFRQVEERVRALPGVEAATTTNGAPFLGASETSIKVVGRPEPEQGKTPMAVVYYTGPEHLRTFGIRLLRGRFIEERDTLNSQRVVVIDEEFARQQFPGEDPIGKYLKGNPEQKIPDAEIVGVVGHVRHYGLDAPGPVQAEFYHPRSQVPLKFQGLMASRTGLAVRTAGDPLALAPLVRREVQAVDPNQPVYNVNTMEEVLNESVSTQRLSMLLLALFAGVALVLASVGIYGVMSYTVAQRTHEIGVRMALGAQGRDVFRMVVGRGMGLVLAGLGIGLVAAMVLMRLMASLLYGVEPTDPATYAAVALVLGLVALVACLVPALRATRVDPTVALRYE